MRRLSSAGIVGLLAVLVTVPLPAQTTAPTFGSVFGDNMVLPHGRAVTLSGSADPRAQLTLEVAAADQDSGDGNRYTFAADPDGQWQTQIASLPAGGPYRLSLRDGTGQQQVLDNVLAGQVWLCSGQSNMAYSVAASVDQPEPYNHGTAAIRLLSVPLRAELEAHSEFVDDPAWQLATDETVPRFSAVCYFAARRMIEQDGIPRGLINASWGGSAIEAWISEDGLMEVDGYDHKVSQLQQFRRDRRAAELAFADDWVQWWQSSSNQGRVWEQGVLDERADWREAPLVNWKTYPDERLSNHHGILWFSTSFRLSEAQSRQRATFVLGKIDEVDTTWINGRFVNNTFGYGTRREYPLEPGVLEPGINQITVNVLNTWDVGGMLGPADEVGLRFADGSFVSLGTSWRYRFIPRETGQPPRSPWESVAGVTGMFNGMISPLTGLQPDGVIWYQGESNAETSATYRALLLALIDDWRRHFQKETLPFVIVQLPNYGSIATTPGRSGWATIRNAQQQVALADDRVGLVVTHDVGNDADIHPRSKFVV
ncbi:MAG: sialate O-acetylesterase, partial [Gammaproteobacteria bacterium]